MPINVYVANLEKRKERFESIQKEFANKNEFNLNIVSAIEKKVPAWGLWQTFHRIVEKESYKETPYFIFCEDDHCFTKDYSLDYLDKCIKEAEVYSADILSGGMSWFDTPVQVSDNLFWVSKFNGMQFVIIFARFYERILSSKTDDGYITDLHLSRLSHKIFVTFPYISKQKDFGYSDVTQKNNIEGRIEKLFQHTQFVLARITFLNRFQKTFFEHGNNNLKSEDVSDTYINTFVINLPERTERLKHFKDEMLGKQEYSITIFKAYKHEIGAVGLWKSICDIIKKADETSEDAVLICEDDHSFTSDYDRDVFLRKAMLAGKIGAEMLSGGVSGFDYLVPCENSGLCFMENFWGTQFVVVYKSAYHKILNAEFAMRDSADEMLSKILNRKMVTIPFISVQKDFGYSDATISNNAYGIVSRYFHKSIYRLKHYEYAINKFVINSKKTVYPNILPRDYIKMNRFRKLNIECNENILNGWYNTDSNPMYGAHFMDMLKPFPFPDESIDRVFCQYTLNRLEIKETFKVLQECYRILRVGGRIRLTLYSIQNLTNITSGDRIRYINWYKQFLFAKDNHIQRIFSNDLLLEFIITDIVKNKNLKYLYSFSSIKRILEEIGYKDVELLRFGHSDDPMLDNIEYSSQEIPSFVNGYESISVEAEK